MKYSFPGLRSYKSMHMKQTLVHTSSDNNEKYSTYTLYLQKKSTRISSYIRLPNKPGIYPIAILLRGYVDKKDYFPGNGTQRISDLLASNGYITIAPDFLGYGKSSKASTDSLEERFQTYTTVLDVLNSTIDLNATFQSAGITNIEANTDKIAIWGHSNGGHIALSILALTGKQYPTVLWAPVSKPFPYSILYYTDEYADKGKFLRKIVSNFEDEYDISKFDPTNYYKWIKAPIQIHQGDQDNAVPTEWSTELNETLTKLGINSSLVVHSNSDHNMMPDGWISAASETLDFFNSQLK